jgi:hypothetical protein
MTIRQTIVHASQRVIATDGKAYTVALILNEQIYAHDSGGWLKAITVCGDAWGGEHDQEYGLIA